MCDEPDMTPGAPAREVKTIVRGRDFLLEADVLAIWPMLSMPELRRARKRKALTFYAFRDQTRYTEADITDYIDRTYKRPALVADTAEEPKPRDGNPMPKMARAVQTHSLAEQTEEEKQFVAEVLVAEIKRRAAESRKTRWPAKQRPGDVSAKDASRSDEV